MKRPDTSIQTSIQLKSFRSWNVYLKRRALEKEIRNDVIQFLDLINKELDSLGFRAEPHGEYRYVRFHNHNFDDNYLQARNIYIHGTIPQSPYDTYGNVGFFLIRHWPNGERDGQKEDRYIIDAHKLSIGQIAQIMIELLNDSNRKIKEYLDRGFLYPEKAYKLMMGTLYKREQGKNDDLGAIPEW